jgi:hypothetical protein
MESKLVFGTRKTIEKHAQGKFGSRNLGEMKKTLNCCPPVTFKRME